MAEEVVIRIDAQDAASGKLRELIGTLNRTEGEVKDLDQQSRKTGQGAESMGASMFKATLGAEAVMEAARMAGRAVVALGRELVDMVTETARAGTEAHNLASSLGTTVGEVQALQYAFEAFGADGRDVADVFNTLADRAEDAKGGMQSFIDDFALIGIEVDDLKGKQPAELFDTFVESVSEMEDVGKRNAAVVRLLGDDVGNKLLPLLSQGEEGLKKFKQEARDLGLVMSEQAAKDAFAFQRSVARLQGALTGIQRKIGAGVMPVLTALMDAFQAAVGPVNLSTEAIRNMAFNAVDKAMGAFIRLLQALDDLSPLITGVITYAKNLAQIWKINFNVVQAVGKTILGTLVKALSSALGAIESLIGGAGAMADALGLDMAKSIKSAERSLAGFRAEMDRFAGASLDSAGEDIEDIDDALGTIMDNIADAPGIDDELSARLQAMIRKAKIAKEEVAKARLASPDQVPGGGGGDGGGAPASPAESTGEEAEAAEDTAQTEIDRLSTAAELEAKMAGREIIARKELQAMQMQDKSAAARVRHEARMLKLAQQDLTVSELKMQRLRSEKKMREEIAAAQEESTEKAVEGMEDFAAVAKKSGNAVVSDMGSVVDVFAKMEKGEADAADALGAAGQAATTVADQLGASAAAQAGIMAVFQTAMGFATMYQNPPEAAAHFISAATFAGIAVKNAAQAGKGGGGGGKPSGAGVRSDTQQASEQGANALVEALSRADQMEGKSQTVIYDFSGATMLESAPATQNRISKASEQGQKRTVRVGGRS